MPRPKWNQPRFKLPESLGGSEVKVLTGMAQPDARADLVDVQLADGTAFSISRKVLVEVPAPLPPEPANGAVVKCFPTDAVYERFDDEWWTPGAEQAFDWAYICGGGDPVLLTPVELVELPWSGWPFDVTTSSSGPSVQVTVDHKRILLKPERAREMSRALAAAANAADGTRETPA